jgi:hypothetical protein
MRQIRTHFKNSPPDEWLDSDEATDFLYETGETILRREMRVRFRKNLTETTAVKLQFGFESADLLILGKRAKG